MAMIGKVRRMHFRQGKSVREIVRLTSLWRNTVRKRLNPPSRSSPIEANLSATTENRYSASRSTQKPMR